MRFAQSSLEALVEGVSDGCLATGKGTLKIFSLVPSLVAKLPSLTLF